jgi:hypothetical protein
MDTPDRICVTGLRHRCRSVERQTAADRIDEEFERRRVAEGRGVRTPVVMQRLASGLHGGRHA